MILSIRWSTLYILFSYRFWFIKFHKHRKRRKILETVYLIRQYEFHAILSTPRFFPLISLEYEYGNIYFFFIDCYCTFCYTASLTQMMWIFSRNRWISFQLHLRLNFCNCIERSCERCFMFTVENQHDAIELQILHT